MKKIPNKSDEIKVVIFGIILIAALVIICLTSDGIKEAVVRIIIFWITSLLICVFYFRIIKKQSLPEWFKNAGRK